MHLRLFLLSHAATPAMRRGDFPADDALDARGIDATRLWSERVRALRADATYRSPDVCVAQTADLLGLPAQVAPALAEADYGRWRQQSLADIADSEPAALATWLGEPDAAPHGGESFGAVTQRVGGWMDSLPEQSGAVVALTHASVIRAAILHALGAPVGAHARIEIAPLSLVELRRSARGWSWMAAPQAAPV